MELSSIYVDGVLKHIAQSHDDKVALRIACNKRVRVYFDGNKHSEIEEPFNEKLYGSFDPDDIMVQHAIAAYVEGDKVTLSRIFDYDDDGDKFHLTNETLSPLAGEEKEYLSLADLRPTSFEKDMRGVEVSGRLEHIAWDNDGKVAFRIRCFDKSIVREGKKIYEHETEDFRKKLFGELDAVDLQLGPENLASFKRGDRVSLTRLLETDQRNDLYFLDNLSLLPTEVGSGYVFLRELCP